MKHLNLNNFRQKEHKTLHVATRELGHGLQTRPAGELAAIRGELASINAEEKDDYRRGFLDAIGHLLAGFMAETKHRAAIAEDVGTSKLRKNAAKILLALHADVDLPSNIAKHTGLSIPAVSAELKALNEEGFVEQVELDEGHDQRKAPRALTIRGSLLAKALSEEVVSPTAEAARELAPIYVSFMGLLADQCWLGEQHLRDVATARLGNASGAFVYQEFLRHAAARRLVQTRDSMLTSTGPQFASRWKDAFQAAIRHQKNFALEQVKQLGSSREVYFRTTTEMRDECELAFSRYGMRNVHPWCMEDVKAGQLPIPKDQYLLVWSSPAVLTSDTENADLDALIGQASEQHCYASSDVQLPPHVQRLELDAHYVGQ